MRRQTALPRLAREGFVPAGPEKRTNKRNMLIPKTGHPSGHLPTIYDFSDMPREKRVLTEIVETGDIIRRGKHSYLVARVSSYTVDTLAAFQSERADQEPDGSDEPSVGSDHPIDAEDDKSDLEPDYDNEPKNYLPLALTLAEEE